MTSFNLSEIDQQLNAVNLKKQQSGVSFSGKALKLNEEEDASDVVEKIMNCEKLEFLDLEGNTLGPEAAKAISKALCKKGAALKRALWKDMFTGRMKDEIPLALRYLGQGLCMANTRLVELDLSDNAFGPIGVEGLATLLTSNACYTLQELRLNNNGLGISGGKMLAQALLNCNRKSLDETNKPLALKVFIAGRNRLENEGAKALAQVFETLKSLEEVVMPQNGIYHVGIAALASALSSNSNLRILNLNDNTVGEKGANALATVLPSLGNLERLNLGDCLLKTQGAISITRALNSHTALIELNFSYNEIQKLAINSITKAVKNKSLLDTLALDGNNFGEEGVEELRKQLTDCNRISALGSLDEDAYEEDETEDENDENNSENEEGEETETEFDENDQVEILEKSGEQIIVDDFMKNPTGRNLLLYKGFEGNKAQGIIYYLQVENPNNQKKVIEDLIKITMKISSNCVCGFMDIRSKAEEVTDELYEELFNLANNPELSTTLNNALLVHLGLIKPEDKSTFKIDWNLEGCFKGLERVIQQKYFASQTKEMLKLFIELPKQSNHIKDTDALKEAKSSLKKLLDKTSQ